MISRLPQNRYRNVGWILTVLALVIRLVVGSAALPDDSSAPDVRALQALSILCSTSLMQQDGHQGDSPLHHHAEGEQAPIPVVGPELLALLLVGIGLLPAPPRLLSGRFRVAISARGPPRPPFFTPDPRGPPGLI